jgi:hypothetical protein
MFIFAYAVLRYKIHKSENGHIVSLRNTETLNRSLEGIKHAREKNKKIESAANYECLRHTHNLSHNSYETNLELLTLQKHNEPHPLFLSKLIIDSKGPKSRALYRVANGLVEHEVLGGLEPSAIGFVEYACARFKEKNSRRIESSVLLWLCSSPYILENSFIN